MDNKFKVFVPFYNAADWIPRTIRGLRRQDYNDFQCILVDDMSTDNSAQVAEQEISGDDRFRLVKNTEKKYALRNLCDTIEAFEPEDSDIIIILHGDDWLARPDALTILNKNYNETDCWLTYGGMRVWNGGEDISLPNPQNSDYHPFVHKHSLYRQD